MYPFIYDPNTSSEPQTLQEYERHPREAPWPPDRIMYDYHYSYQDNNLIITEPILDLYERWGEITDENTFAEIVKRHVWLEDDVWDNMFHHHSREFFAQHRYVCWTILYNGQKTLSVIPF
jgi:hypothetical protein